MNSIRFGLRLFLGFLAGCWLTACQPEPDHSIRLGLSAPPVTLDPRYATDAESARVIRLLYASLSDFDQHSQAVPALAHWTAITPTQYRFYLGEHGRQFHDGSRLQAEDVAATYRSILDPATASPHRGSLAAIQRIVVLDADTLDFYLAQPNLLFPGLLNIGILPAPALANGYPFNRQALGSGPFRLTAWQPAGALQLTRLRDGQRFRLLPVKDPVVRVLKLLHGELDLLQGNLPAELVAWLDQQTGVRVTRAEGSNFSYLGFNLADPLTGQLAVRQAIAYALDREAIIRYLLGNAARPAGALLPPQHWAGHPELHGYPHDPARAKALLAAAGFGPATPLRLSFKSSSNPLSLRLAAVLQQQLAAVGIELSLHSYDWGTFYSDIKTGHFQTFSLSWVGIKTPDIFRYAFHSSAVPPTGANRGRYADATTDRLIEQAETAPSLAAQAALYRQLEAQLHHTLPVVPLWYEDQILVQRDGVTGYALSADGRYDGLLQVESKQNE